MRNKNRTSHNMAQKIKVQTLQASFVPISISKMSLRSILLIGLGGWRPVTVFVAKRQFCLSRGKRNVVRELCSRPPLRLPRALLWKLRPWNTGLPSMVTLNDKKMIKYCRRFSIENQGYYLA